MSRRGVTLVELTIGLVLFGIIGTVVVRATLQLGRAVGALQQRASAATAFDQGLAFLGAELREAGQGDLRRVAAESLSYRGYRAAGVACRVTATAVDLIVQTASGARAPQPSRDTLLLYRGDEDTTWTALPILAIGGTTCAGAAALRITTLVDSVTLNATSALSLIPVRIFESMQARFYRSADEWWLGARSESAGELVQPLAGPFLPPAGWSYHDSLGAVTSSPSEVQQLLLRLATLPDTAALLVFPANFRR